MLASLINTLKSIVKFFAKPFIEGSSRLNLCRKKYVQAKALGKEETTKAVKNNIKCMASHVVASVVHYCVPVLSAGFLIASVRYTASLEYGIDSTYSKEDIASVTQMQLDELENTLEQNKEVTVFPKFSFKDIQENEETLSNLVSEIKQEEETTQEVDGMSEGFGVFVEDEFLGAVLDKSSIDDTLESMLDEYRSMDGVTDVHFDKKVTYTKGLYLTEYMVDPQTIVDTLSGNAQEDMFYTIEYGDNFTLISQYTGLSIEELLELNPKITDPDVCMAGDTLLIQQAEPFLNVEYTQSETPEPIDEITQPPVEDTTEQPSHEEKQSADELAIVQDPVAQMVISESVEYMHLSESFAYPTMDTVIVKSNHGISISAPRGTPIIISDLQKRGYFLKLSRERNVRPRQFEI
jgi:hypothetical protein